MITEYCLFADESYRDGHLFIGGLICTQRRADALRKRLAELRTMHGLHGEVKWAKASSHYADAYQAWLKVFLDDPFARCVAFDIDKHSPEWCGFNTKKTKGSADSHVASAYHQFMLNVFGRLRDTKRWWVYPDRGLYRSERRWQSIEFLFNRTYKKAFGPNSSRIIRLVRPDDSHQEDLLQLADLLLGTMSTLMLGVIPKSPPRRALATLLYERVSSAPTTERGLPKFQAARWVPPNQFNYLDARTATPLVLPATLAVES